MLRHLCASPAHVQDAFDEWLEAWLNRHARFFGDHLVPLGNGLRRFGMSLCMSEYEQRRARAAVAQGKGKRRVLSHPCSSGPSPAACACPQPPSRPSHAPRLLPRTGPCSALSSFSRSGCKICW